MNKFSEGLSTLICYAFALMAIIIALATALLIFAAILWLVTVIWRAFLGLF